MLSSIWLKDSIRNDHIRDRVDVAYIEDKMREYRLRSFDHVLCRFLKTQIHRYDTVIIECAEKG